MRETILVVEDDEAVRRFTLTVLQGRGYRTLEAFCGDTGLELFRRLHAEISLVLTDVVMPHSGPEMVDEILKLAPYAKIVFMTGTAGLVNFPQNLQRFPVLRKPFSIQELIDHVQSALKEQTRSPV